MTTGRINQVTKIWKKKRQEKLFTGLKKEPKNQRKKKKKMIKTNEDKTVFSSARPQ